MLPMTLGFLVAGPALGLALRPVRRALVRHRGMLIAALSFVWFALLPVDFTYWAFATALFANGFGMGLFASPNRAAVMNALPANRRGVGGGMSTTFQNTSMVLSIGIFFSLMIAGLASSLPATMQSGLTAHGVPAAQAHAVAGLPPVSVLFASLLGYNPVQSLLGSHTLAQLLACRRVVPHRSHVLPVPDLRSLPRRPGRRLRLRDRRLPGRRRGVVADG